MSRSSFGKHAWAWLVVKPGSGHAGRLCRSRCALGGLLALVMLAVGLLGPLIGTSDHPVLQPADRWLYDLRLRALAPPQADPQIVVIDIDERALAEHGRWPWRRSLLATLLERAAGPGGARLLGLDLVLAEPDRSADLAALDSLVKQLANDIGQGGAAGLLHDSARMAQALHALRPQLDDDGRLIDVLRRYPVVLGFHLSNEVGAARIGQLPPPLVPVALLGDQADGLLRWAGHGGNLPALQTAHLGAGHLNALVDADGLVRRLPMLIAHDGGVHGALALVMARALLAGDTDARPARKPADGLMHPPGSGLTFEPASGPWQALRLSGPAGHLRLPLDAQAVALVPYTAPGTGFVRHSAADVLAGRLGRDALRGKVVLVGVSAPGLIDQRATPVDALMLGTLVHAHMLAGLLAGRVLAVPTQAASIEIATLLLLGGLLVWWLPRLALWQGALLTVGLVAALLAAHVAAWQQAGWVLPLASGLLLPAAMLAWHLLLSYRQATGARHQLAQLFGQYVPPELVGEMSREPERHTMRSRSAELTVLFADAQGFSGLAEHMPPAELGAMMNLLFSHLTDVLRQHRGTLDKYIGDSVMAFWGAPLDDPDHAHHAVAAALAMRARLPRLHAEMAAHGWPPLAINIGINTGSMVVGDMGSRHRRAYTVMGDAVNLAARLQALSSQHGLGLVVGEATYRALQRAADKPLCLALGAVQVRGRHAPVQVWQPLDWGAGQNGEADWLAREWRRMHDAADDGRLDKASTLLDELGRHPTLAALCRWQRGRLRHKLPPAITLPPA